MSAPLILLVDGEDHTRDILPDSITINRAITNQVDTMSFTVARTQPEDWKPSIVSIVVAADSSYNILFAGAVVMKNEEMDNGVEMIRCDCKDWTIIFDRKLVVATYENMTVAEIIESIVDDFTLDNFTDDNVDCDVMIDYIAFNYEYPSQCIQQLAELVGYDWYIDGDMDIHFFAKMSVAAPFSLTDDNGNYYIDSLSIKQDATKLKNTVIVRGGEYLGDTYTESYVADGDQVSFTIVNRYNGINVTVNGTPQTIGIDNIHNPADYDILYNFQEKSLKFREDNKPSVGDTVVIEGQPYVPVLTQKIDSSSVEEFGVFEYKIIDRSIGSKQAARDRAQAELDTYHDMLDDGSFQTRENGLDVGQLINVQSTLRGINEDFIITRITTKVGSADTLLHNVTLATIRTFGMVEFLQKLLTAKDKEIKIALDEVLDRLVNFTDRATVTDEMSPVITTSPPYTYEGGINDFNWGFGTWS